MQSPFRNDSLPLLPIGCCKWRESSELVSAGDLNFGVTARVNFAELFLDPESTEVAHHALLLRLLSILDVSIVNVCHTNQLSGIYSNKIYTAS